MYIPHYITLHRNGELEKKVDELSNILEMCVLCPFECKINRTKGEFGFCKAGFEPEVTSAHAVFGSIPELKGKFGSGHITFKSQKKGETSEDADDRYEAEEFDADELARQMFNLQLRGCHNISLVNPTNYAAQIIEALPLAIDQGFSLPLIWNCTGLESLRILKILSGIIDVYQLDFSLISRNIHEDKYDTQRLITVLKDALHEIFSQITNLEISPRTGVLNHGIVIRNLSALSLIQGLEEFPAIIDERSRQQSILTEPEKGND